MIGPTLRLHDYLQHIIEVTERISAYTEGLDHAAFLLDAKTQDAVMRNLQIIGEAATHGYFNVGLERVWSTIEDDLPPFEAQLRALLAGLA